MSVVGKVLRQSASFLDRNDGMAAIEFAFIAPVLIGAALALVDVAAIVTGSANMQTAVHSGIQYVINGGTDMTTAEDQINQAWTTKPAGGSVSSQQYCKCGNTVSACTAPCADGTVPASYVTLTATASLGGTTFSVNKTATETVRIR
jgi:Flp pilus assembly protein TadG